MNKVDQRIPAIINELIVNRGIASNSEIACVYSERYGTGITKEEIRTAVHLMEKDSGLGLFAPIYYDAEKDGYLYSEPGYSIVQESLTEKDLEDVALAVKLLDQFKYRDLFRSFSGIIQKMLDVMRIRETNTTGRPYDFIDFEKVGASRGSRFILPLIRAIDTKKVIELTYQPFYEEKSHSTIVHPYLLKEYRYRWYLIGLNDLSGEIRTYGLDRVREITITDKPYMERTFSAEEYFRHTIGVIAPQGVPPVIKIKADKPQALYFITQPWHESQNIEKEDDVSVTFSYRVHPTYEFKALILSYGQDVEVLEPLSLREEIAGLLQKAASKYQR